MLLIKEQEIKRKSTAKQRRKIIQDEKVTLGELLVSEKQYTLFLEPTVGARRGWVRKVEKREGVRDIFGAPMCQALGFA